MPFLIVSQGGRYKGFVAFAEGAPVEAVPGHRVTFTRRGEALVATPAKKVLENGDQLELAGHTLTVLFESAPGSAPRRELEALFLLASSCHARLDSRNLMEGIMDCLLHIAGAERGFILTVPETGGPGVLPLVVRKVDLAGTDRSSRTVARRVLETGASMRVEDITRDKELSGQESLLVGRVRSLVAAPLGKSPATGVVYLDSSTRAFAAADLELLEAAAVHVDAALRNARERDRLKKHAERLAEVVAQEVGREFDPHAIVGESEPVRDLKRTLAKLAPQDTAVLVLGESGTGKELVARALHVQSKRAAGPFVPVNCMALPPNLLEAELFGHEKGAFTGATERRLGRFELADGGTLFLDEIGELDLGAQTKLLRVLQERMIERVGSSRAKPIDVRLVCATNADLEKAVAEKRFREDLFYRINVFPIRMPPLRERADDVPLLARHFLALFARRMGKAIDGIDDSAVAALTGYRWPGNIRELRNVIERATVLETGPRLSLQSLPFTAAEPATAAVAERSLTGARDEFERKFILECLARHRGKIAPAARELDVPRSTIYRKLELWGLAGPSDGEV